jgi:hypothetical protein
MNDIADKYENLIEVNKVYKFQAGLIKVKQYK